MVAPPAGGAGSLPAMTTNASPPPPPAVDHLEELEADDAGLEGHAVPADLLELHALTELANNGGPT